MNTIQQCLAAVAVLIPIGGAAAQPQRKVEVIVVRPNKIVYADGEAGTAMVRLYNTTDRPLKVTLKPTLKWDLDQSKALPDVLVSVPAKDNAEARLPLPASGQRWGHEIEVRAVVDGKGEDIGRQFFGVHSEWMDLILLSFARQAYKDNGLLMSVEPFSTYTTVQHWFAWAPGDYTDNAPQVDEWYSGQAGYHMFKDKIREQIKDCQDKGIHCTFYNNSFSGGKSGLEWARRHPEWICRKRDGSPMLGGDPLALSKPYSDKATGQMGQANMGFYDPKCIEWGAKNVLESIEMFGWDGMFWDCGGCALFPGFTYDGKPTPHGQDPGELSARNFKLFHDTVRAKHPNFGVWINGSIDHFKQPFWSRFGNGGGVATMQSEFSTPQTTLLVEHRHHANPGGRFHQWQYTYDQYVKERDAITQRHGAPIIAGYTSFNGFPAQSHLAAIILASQMRPANCHQEGSWPMTQFMTRYSALLWRRDVKTIPKAKALFRVKTSRPVWWERTVYRRPTGGGEDIMVHFVNKPTTENCDPTVKENPPPASATVTFTIPQGKTLKTIYALQPRLYRPGVDPPRGLGLDVGGMPATMTRVPDPDNPGKTIQVHKTGSLCRGGPTQVKLPFTRLGSTVTIEVPEFVYHTMLVFRLRG